MSTARGGEADSAIHARADARRHKDRNVLEPVKEGPPPSGPVASEGEAGAGLTARAPLMCRPTLPRRSSKSEGGEGKAAAGDGVAGVPDAGSRRSRQRPRQLYVAFRRQRELNPSEGRACPPKLLTESVGGSRCGIKFLGRERWQLRRAGARAGVVGRRCCRGKRYNLTPSELPPVAGL